MHNRWAVVLAGGEGSTAATPRQFSRFLSGLTLLEETSRRLATTVDKEHTLFLLTQKHRRFYEPLRRQVPAARLVEQPAHRGTTLAMAFALGRLARVDPDGVVGFFPSDHYYGNINAFGLAASAAYQVAALRREHLVLIGASAHKVEPDYGWIEPGPALSWPETDARVFAVHRFVEAPGLADAVRLLERRCFWNTFMTFGTVDAFRDALGQVDAALRDTIDAIASVGPGAGEQRIVADAYRELAPRDFAAGVLARPSTRCLVVPMTGSGWMDISRPDRISDARSGDQQQSA